MVKIKSGSGKRQDRCDRQRAKNGGREYDGGNEQGLQLEESLQRTLMGTPNQKEAVVANFEKRAPNFQNRD